MNLAGLVGLALYLIIVIIRLVVNMGHVKVIMIHINVCVIIGGRELIVKLMLVKT